MLDYMRWRGDLPMDVSPFTEIDALIFSQLSYLHFDNALGMGQHNVFTWALVGPRFATLTRHQASTGTLSGSGALNRPHCTVQHERVMKSVYW